MLIVKWGRNGSFLACSGYPECRNTKEFTKDADGKIQVVPEETTDELCKLCGSAMKVRTGRFGKFFACTKYPECKGTKPITTGIKCPECNEGELTEKRSKRGKTFFSCSAYPACKFALWDKPIKEPCPQCGAPFLVQKYTKKDGASVKCWKPDCGYVQTAADAPAAEGEAGTGTPDQTAGNA
jgi:DNA topoisomerase-1